MEIHEKTYVQPLHLGTTAEVFIGTFSLLVRGRDHLYLMGPLQKLAQRTALYLCKLTLSGEKENFRVIFMVTFLIFIYKDLSSDTC